jgi:hypothetical protein
MTNVGPSSGRKPRSDVYDEPVAFVFSQTDRVNGQHVWRWRGLSTDVLRVCELAALMKA